MCLSRMRSPVLKAAMLRGIILPTGYLPVGYWFNFVNTVGFAPKFRIIPGRLVHELSHASREI